MKNFKKIILIFFYSLIVFSNVAAIENKILFKVNNEIITSIDILTELKYLGTINNDLNKMPKKQAFEIAKKSLIREKIKEDEDENKADIEKKEKVKSKEENKEEKVKDIK